MKTEGGPEDKKSNKDAVKTSKVWLPLRRWYIRRKRNKKPTAEELLKEAADQKKVLEENKDFQKSLQRVEKAQKRVLEENPEFMKQLEALRDSLGRDGKYDKAVLAEVLQKSREIYEQDPKMRLYLKQQEQALANNAELLEKVNSLASMQKQVLQVS